MSAYCNLTGVKLGKRLSPTLIDGVLKKKKKIRNCGRNNCNLIFTKLDRNDI